ncbi:DgyrCDS6468 [Dimorphilus gyrociliatus]|uniref:Short-chain dehydrogenase/reductase 3 n=1 Tax=Dimorphilus gyrociliatus TaxID=2664684 RepID=A0A7I8VN60_9ANNE|nr:DgyrCDS6468 [Dimorphilus gyrociliatus]
MFGKITEVPMVLATLIFSYFEVLYRMIVPRPRKSIAGQVALITGAGGGIGFQESLQFAAEGAKVILVDVNKKLLNKVVTAVEEKGGTVYSYVCDITSKSEVDLLFEKIWEDVGQVDILVNNAGVMPVRKISDLSQREIELTFHLNIICHFWLIQHVLPGMKKRRSGHIVEIASMAGVVGKSMLTDYCSSKFAVVGLSESLKHELQLEKFTDIHVTCICPMFVDTHLISNVLDHSNYKTDVLLTPEHVASVIVDATLRNKFMVSIPGYLLSLVYFLKLYIPMRALIKLDEFMREGFFPKTKAE